MRDQCKVDLTVLINHIELFKNLLISFLVYNSLLIGSVHQFILFHWCILILHSHTPFRRTASGLKFTGKPYIIF